MKHDIHYDFTLSDGVAEKLNASAHELNTHIIKPSDDDCTLLWYAWNSQASELFVRKYRDFIGELSSVRDELFAEAEEINRISRIMRIKEEEAARLATEREV